MFQIIFAVFCAFTTPADHGLFEAAGLYLLKVTAVKVPDHAKLLGETTFRADEVLIGPEKIKGKEAKYKFFTPSSELDPKNWTVE